MRRRGFLSACMSMAAVGSIFRGHEHVGVVVACDHNSVSVLGGTHLIQTEGSPQPKQLAYLTDDDKVSPHAAGVVVGCFMSEVNAEGYAHVLLRPL